MQCKPCLAAFSRQGGRLSPGDGSRAWLVLVLRFARLADDPASGELVLPESEGHASFSVAKLAMIDLFQPCGQFSVTGWMAVPSATPVTGVVCFWFSAEPAVLVTLQLVDPLVESGSQGSESFSVVEM